MEKWKLINYHERTLDIFGKQSTDNAFILAAQELIDKNHIIEALHQIVKLFQSKLIEKSTDIKNNDNLFTWFAERCLMDKIIAHVIRNVTDVNKEKCIEHIAKLIEYVENIISRIYSIPEHFTYFYQCTYYRRLLANLYLMSYEFTVTNKYDKKHYQNNLLQKAKKYYDKGFAFFENERRDAPQMHILVLTYCIFYANYDMNNESIVKRYSHVHATLKSQFDDSIERLDTGGVGEGGCSTRYKQNCFGLQLIRDEMENIANIGEEIKKEIVSVIERCKFNVDGNIANVIVDFLGNILEL